MTVHLRHGAEPQEQLPGRLGSHTGNPGDVVRAIPHEAFQIHQNGGREAILRLEGRLVIAVGRGLAALGQEQLHLHMGVDELQAVPVPGDHHAVPVLLAAPLAHGADDVVCLPALALQDGNVHGPEDLLQKGHLLGQLLGHPMAGGLIAVVPQVAEGGALEVKGHADPIGALLLLHALQDVQEAKNGVGVQPLPGGQGPDAVKRPVDHAVAV